VILCPICNCEWPTQPTRCVCGYDFQTGNTHEAVRSLMIQYRKANRRWLAGIGLIISIAGSIIASQLSPAIVLALPIILTMQVLFGLGLVATGLRSGIKLGRQIARAKVMNQLPEARLLK
jgi:hypothetical protein